MRSFTLILGIVLVVVGIAGIVSGSHDHEFTVFGINMAHNFVHLVSGALAILAATSSAGAARLFCVWFGIVYGIVAIAGFAGLAPVVDALNLNTADNVLHLAISAACLITAVTAGRRVDVSVAR